MCCLQEISPSFSPFPPPPCVETLAFNTGFPVLAEIMLTYSPHAQLLNVSYTTIEPSLMQLPQIIFQQRQLMTYCSLEIVFCVLFGFLQWNLPNLVVDTPIIHNPRQILFSMFVHILLSEVQILRYSVQTRYLWFSSKGTVVSAISSTLHSSQCNIIIVIALWFSSIADQCVILSE